LSKHVPLRHFSCGSTTVLPQQPLMAWCIPVLNSNNWARYLP
ncbi:hypothetical protein T4B_11372, partial [Trichinella pseudospiralis]